MPAGYGRLDFSQAVGIKRSGAVPAAASGNDAVRGARKKVAF
jgi:hypothetical protein